MSPGASPERLITAEYVPIADGLVGLSAQRADRPGTCATVRHTSVTDSIQVDDDPSHALLLSRDVRAFFQGNRFLVEALVRRVARIGAALVL